MKINSKFSRIVGVGLSVAMLASMVATVSPAFALTQPTVTVTGTTISRPGSYLIAFTAGANLTTASGAQYIQVVFPPTTEFTNLVSTAGNDSSIILHVLAGISGGPYGPYGVTFNKTAAGAASPTLNITVPAPGIGAGSLVGITIGNSTAVGGNITNPIAAGNYTLTVALMAGSTVVEAAVTSAPYTISNPTVGALPGVASVYNPNNILMSQSNSINTALTSINNTNNYYITLTAGTYVENLNTDNISSSTFTGITVGNGTVIRAADGVAANTVNISGTVTLNSTKLTLKNVLITGRLVVGEAANTTIVEGVTVTKSSSTSGAGLALLLYNSTAPNQVSSFINSTFDATRGTVVEMAANVSVPATVGASFSGCTFKGDQYDTLLWIQGGNLSAPLTVSGCTFQGASATDAPQGIVTGVLGGFNSVINNTFTNCNTALITNAASNTTATNNTLTACGNTSAFTTTEGAVVSNGGTLILINNTIANSAAANYALNVQGGNVTARFNNITGNTLNVNQAGAGTANASLNWWGSTNIPAAMNSTNAALLVTKPYLRASTSGNSAISLVATSNLSAQATAGVDIATANGTLAEVAASKLASNTELVVPPGNPIAYFDVYFTVVTGAEPGSVTVRLYNAGITANTRVYYGGGLTGAWTEASSQGVNLNGGYAYVTITAASMPSYGDMDGTPFALSNSVPPPAAPTLTGPAAGATGVPINTGFSWAPITGATYNFQLSMFATFNATDASATGLTSNVYGLTGGMAGTLKNSMTYFWRVQAVTAGGTSAWTTGTFTTAAAAAPTTPPAPPVVNVAPANVTVTPPNVTVNPPTVNVAAPPAATVNVAPPTVNVAAPPAPAVTVNVPEQPPLIPNYILWTIILIGAVLVIALIVLIVRTRRVA